jgi:signal transduction histidine kinase
MKSESEKSPVDLKETTTVREISPLLCEVIHDLKNALAIIRGFTELTLRDRTLKDSSRKNLEKILEGVSRTRDQIQRIPMLPQAEPPADTARIQTTS